MQHRASDWIILIALVAIWGSTFMLVKVALAHFPPSTLVAFRLLTAAGLLLLILYFSKEYWHSVTPRLFFYFIIMAILGNVLPFFSISWGQQYVDSSLAGILMAVMPLITLFLSHFFIPNSRLNMRMLTGFILGFAGVVIILDPNQLFSFNTGHNFKAELAILFGALCYAVNTIIARRRPESNDFLTSAVVLGIAAMIMLPTSLSIEEPWINLPVSLSSLFALGFIGVMSTALATVLYFRLISSAGPTFLSQINYLIPVWALIVGYVVLGETIHMRSIVGLALLLAGLALANSRNRHKTTV